MSVIIQQYFHAFIQAVLLISVFEQRLSMPCGMLHQQYSARFKVKLTCNYILQCNSNISKIVRWCFELFQIDSELIRIKFMKYAMDGKNSFCWPPREDICSHQFLDIISVIDPPVPISQGFFGLCKKDFEDINSSFTYVIPKVFTDIHRNVYMQLLLTLYLC